MINHIDVYLNEKKSLQETDWERDAADIEKLMGCSIDGNHDVDGYSVDAAYLLWKCGHSPQMIYGIFKRKISYADIEKLSKMLPQVRS